MAVITISRQVAALGDEVAEALAKKIGYTFIHRQEIEKRIVELGFPESKLKKYDERKPGFFASLAKGRDEYLNYLQYAVLEAASKNNCILIGRGAFVILHDVPNLLSLRLVTPDSIRLERLKKEFSWNEKQAQARIDESAENRKGFHKSFFNIDNEDSQFYHMTVNTGLFSIEESVDIIESVAKKVITPEKEKAAKSRVENLLKAQDLANKLLFEHNLNINFLVADINEAGDTIVLQGVAESSSIVDRAVDIASKIVPSCTVKSAISIVQDFKNFQ